MYKNILCIAAVVVVGCGLSACESDRQNVFQLACEASGGISTGDQCKCPGETGLCNAGVTCREDPEEDNKIKCAKSSQCSENAMRCINEDNTGVLQTCRQGSWQKTNTCESGVSCFYNIIDDDDYGKEMDPGVCGDCVNKQEMITEENENGIGHYRKCENGKWSADEECENEASLSTLEDGTQVCGVCKNGTIKCSDGETSKYHICQNGVWSEEIFSCPGNASCSDNQCQDAELTSCTENWCEDGKIRECINGKFTEFHKCENSDGCIDGTECGECRSDALICSDADDDEGSIIKACNNYQWQTSFNTMSCKSASEQGVCTNGYYRYITKGEGEEPRIIQQCVKGSWPSDDDSTRKFWPNYVENNALYANIAVINYNNTSTSSLTLYSNYYAMRSGIFLPKLNYNDLTDMYAYVSNENTSKIYSVSNSNAPNNCIFDKQDNSCAFYDKSSKYEFSKYYFDAVVPYENNSWMNCTTHECNVISLCVDAVITDDVINNIPAYPYKLLIYPNAEQTDHPHRFEFYSSKNNNAHCNSNHTDFAGECDSNNVNLLDMAYYLDDEFKESGDNTKAFSLDPSKSIAFDLCRYGKSREVECDTIFDAEERYSCKFKQMAEGNSFDVGDNKSICIDFYDKSYHHVAYKVSGLDKNRETVIPLLDAAVGSKYMAKCPLNLCNSEWTDCLCIDEEGAPCTCNDAMNGCK